MKQNWRIDIDEVPGEGTAFNPPTVTVAPGDLVFWRNNTNTAHQPVATPSPPDWQVSEIPGRQPAFPDDPSPTSGTVSFAGTGTFAYICALHPSETGTIIVKAPSS
jgi:plastocyanin